MATIAEISKLAERLYSESMKSGERERLKLPVDSSYWEQRAREVLEYERLAGKAWEPVKGPSK